MLDLNFVRNNLDAVRAALANRNFPADALDKFVELDAERRRVIGEADQINQQRNAASKEIGSLMQAGNAAEAETKKADVAALKDKQAELERRRDESATTEPIPHRTSPASNRQASGYAGSAEDRLAVPAGRPATPPRSAGARRSRGRSG